MLRSAFLSVLCLLTSQLSAQNPANTKNTLPEIGVVASDAITLAKEMQIGDALMRQMRAQAPLVRDPVIEEYIQDIGNRLVIEADNVKFPFRFFILNSRSINAFAFFGGHIGVHTGLIFNARNESELASVLAHEISHVTQRHIARRIQSQQKASPLALASALGGILLAIANPEAGMAALSVGSAASKQASINYTRSNEKEADRIGIHILAQAGFDPRGAANFFGKLAEQYRHVSKPPAFLLTHPLPESRIADARTRAAAYRTRNVPQSLEFHLVKARIQARYYFNPKRNKEYFERQLKSKKYAFKQAVEYGLALTRYELEDYQGAKELIERLLADDPENLFYLDTASDIYIALDKHDNAIELLTQYAQLRPHNQVLTINLANACIEKGLYNEAIEQLKDYLLINPEHMLAQELLTDAYEKNKNMLEMHQSSAEVLALAGAYPNAIDELHTAYNYAAERKLEKQRIRARIDQFREAQERLKALQ